MKQLFTNILFFVACTVILTARAQNDTINPLWSTTGPAILSNGAMQWDNILEWNHMNASGSSGITQYNSINGNSVLRLGIGSKSELTLGLTGGNTTYHYDNGINNGYDTTMGSLSPQVGMRMSLYDGKGWLPNNLQYPYIIQHLFWRRQFRSAVIRVRVPQPHRKTLGYRLFDRIRMEQTQLWFRRKLYHRFHLCTMASYRQTDDRVGHK